MTLLAFPSAAILIMRIVRLYLVEARRTNEPPIAVLLSSDAVEHVIRLLASTAGFCPDAFDLHHGLPALRLGAEAAKWFTGVCFGKFCFVLGHTPIRPFPPHLE